MLGAGTIINPILKIVTTVAILGAVYLFIVKPTLDTTETISDSAFERSEQIREDIQQSIDDSFEGVPNNIDVEIPKSVEKAQKLGDCVSGAEVDVAKIQRCTERFSP